jgi:hypothetical protein
MRREYYVRSQWVREGKDVLITVLLLLRCTVLIDDVLQRTQSAVIHMRLHLESVMPIKCAIFALIVVVGPGSGL